MYLVAIDTANGTHVTDLAVARKAVRELVGPGRKVEIDDPEVGMWMTTLTRPLATQLRTQGEIQLANANYALTAEWV